LGLHITIKFGNHYSTSVDNKWLPQRVNLEEVQNTLLVDKKNFLNATLGPCKKYQLRQKLHWQCWGRQNSLVLRQAGWHST